MLKQLRYFFTLMLLAVASVGWADSWVKTAASDLQTGDIVVIVDETSGTAMFNDNGASKAPDAVAFDAEDVAETIQWEVTVDGDNYQFNVPGTEDYLYCTNVNNGVRVGKNDNNVFTIADDGNGVDFLLNSGTSRYIGVYKNQGTPQDWRCYTSINNNIKDCELAFYKLSTGGVTKKTATVTIDATTIEIGEDTEVNTNGPTLTLATSDASIASVDGTTVTGVAAGTATITATWAENDEFKAGTKTFTVTVVAPVDPNAPGTENNPYTVAEALEVIDGLADNGYSDFVYVKGIISGIKSLDVSRWVRAQYNISDDGTENDQLLVYNGYYLNGADFTSNDQIQVGDEVVVYGKLQKFVRNGSTTPEVATDNKIVSIVKSGKPSAELAFEPTELTVELGDDITEPTLNNPYNVAVTYSSSDENVAEVDTDGSLTINGAGTATITATFAGDDNYAAGEASYTLTVVDPDAPGASIDNPYTVEEAIAFIETLGTNTSGEVYVKGIISLIDEVSTEHGNATYWISDDGETAVQMEVYRGKYLENVDFTDAGQIAVGDEVIVYGKLKKYGETPEFNQGNYLVYLDHTDAPVLEDAGLAYDVETFTATIDEDNEFPVLANPNELPVTYTSSNEDVATIDADGNITLVAAGETTITATSEETSEFKAGEASYVLTVEEKPEPGEGVQYQLVTSTDDITSGKYLIVSKTKEGTYVALDGSLETLDAVENIKEVSVENNVISTDQDIYFNIDVENGTLQSASGFYIGQTANSNGLKQSEDATAYTNTFAIDEDGYAVISVAVGENTLTMRFNYAVDQLRFRYYKSGQQPIYLFKAVDEVEGETVPVTISSAEWATLYYSDKAFEIPEGVTAKIVVAIDDNDVIDFEDLNGIIPAGTAVALNGPQGTYDFKVVNDETVAPANNLLRGFDIPHLTEGGDIYYKLTVLNDKVGFYWGEENGDAFETGAHKAYLALSAEEANGVKFFVLGTAGDLVSEDGGFVDGINEVTASDSKNEYFNLNGTRVNSLRKGIYIVGGKKVVIK